MCGRPQPGHPTGQNHEEGRWRVELSEGWLARGDVTSLQAAAKHFFHRHGMRVIGEQAGEIHLRQGSWLARVFGPLAPSAWLSKRAVVKFAQTEEGVSVRASIEEETSAGCLSPRLMEKYHSYFVRWINELKAELV
jgi:hypothetical protein